MTVAPVSSTSNQNMITGSTDASVTGFANNFNTFLTLLTTQLKNQDPLSPMNSTDFTTQLVQFASVEQQMKQNQTLSSILTAQQSSQASSAVGFLDKTIEAKADTAQLTNGAATFAYTMNGAATTTKIQILDSSGNVVRNAAGKTARGPQSFTWDGRDDSGKILNDGKYSIKVTAIDANGNPVNVSTNISGVVSSVSTSSGSLLLTVGASQVALSDVVSVSDTPVN